MFRTALTLRHFIAGLCGAAALTAPVLAQTASDGQSRAVVQPLPPAGAADLNAALLRLARDTRDVDALINAGNASLRLSDIDAAIGFFGRADELSPGNARAKVGLAGAFVRSERPIEALRLFDDAERAGASTAELAEERGLAYDLVGDPVSAQAQYARAMTVRPGDELIRRLALSQAISGDRIAFEKTLYPLLARRDFAAYRTRAFALAILGDEDEAVAIAEAVMPPELAARMTPYLRYMERLTKAQQAAAANLGIFPRAAQIGRDDVRIAQYSGSASPRTAPIRTADAGLAPQGKPLGPAPSDVASPRRRPGRERSAVPAAADTPRSSGAKVPLAKNAVNSSGPSAPASLSASVPIAVFGELPAAQPTQAAALPQIATVEAQKPGFDLAQSSLSQTASSTAAPATAVLAVESVAVVQEIPKSSPAAEIPSPASPAPNSPAPNSPAPNSPSVADAFTGFTLASVAPDKSGAVDISAIKPRREVAKPEPAAKPAPVAKPEPPKHPSRVWVQIATGRDRKALAFDWRRISRNAPDILGDKAKPAAKPHVARWGQTNRLLAGPFASEKAAQVAVSALKAGEIDSFTFTSTAGEEIDKLP